MSGIADPRAGILCAGTILVDAGKVIDAYPPLDHLATIEQVSLSTGGPALNMAVDLSLLGAAFPIAVLGAVGDDEHAAFLLAECARLGIDTAGVRQLAGAVTSFTDVMVERDGGRRTMFHHSGANARFDASTADLQGSRARILHAGAPGIHPIMDSPLPGGGNGSENVLKLAIDQYEQIVKIEPNNVDDHLLLGRLYRLNNDLQKAESELQTAVKLDPDSEEAVTTLSLLYTDEGDTTKALQVLSSVPDTGKSAKLYAALGATYEQRKEYKSAIDAYRHAIQLDRDNLDAIRGLAENLLNDGQIDAALDQYKVIADANPEDAQTYLRISEIYRRQGKYDEALESLKKAEAMVPDALEVPYNIAVVYEAQARYDEAAKILQDLLKKTEKPDNNYSQADRNNRAIFLERLGMVYRDQENYPAAVEAFRRMIPLGDENTRTAFQDVIDTYRDAKEWAQATAAAKEAVQKLPNDRDLRMVLDAQLADMGDADKPLADVRSLLKGTAEDRDVYLRLAIMYTRLKRWSEAEEALNKAEQLSVKPEDKEYVYFLRGSTLEREKKYDQAEAEFKKILAANPQSAATLNYLGYMDADRGVQLEESLNYIKTAVSLDLVGEVFGETCDF